eukprot:tig00021762_g23458.t1
MRNHFEGIYPPRVPQEQFPRPHYTDHRTHGLSRPGAAQLLQHHGGAAAERDWSPLWIIAGILVGPPLPTQCNFSVGCCATMPEAQKKPAKKAPTNGQEKPTKAEVKEAKEKLKARPNS